MGGNAHKFYSVHKGKKNGQTMTRSYETHVGGLGEWPKRIFKQRVNSIFKMTQCSLMGSGSSSGIREVKVTAQLRLTPDVCLWTSYDHLLKSQAPPV